MRFDPQVVGEAPIYDVRPRLDHIEKPPQARAKKKATPNSKPKPKGKGKPKKPDPEHRTPKSKPAPRKDKNGGPDARSKH